MSRIFAFLLFVGILSLNVDAQRNDIICTTSRFVSECEALQRGTSEVRCIRAQDSVECAQLLINGTADFGVVSAESAYHLATVGWDGITVIKELRHRDRAIQQYDYQSVVVVSKDHYGGLEGLRGSQFCHPGLHYDRHQRWSERFLKHFERTVVPYDCKDGTSPADIEASALSNFFSSVCRPGKWSNNIQEDAELKVKYPKLCNLCDHSLNCSYENSIETSHRQALECLRRSDGAVTYVALQEAREFFDLNSNIAGQYSFLCPNGTLQSVTAELPCVWLTQPWKLVIAKSEMSVSLNQKLSRWMTSNGNWETALKDILTVDSYQISDLRNIVTLRDYINPIRPIPVANPMCNTTSTWCTTSYEEKDKCEVLAAAALTTGILPILECSEPTLSTVSCLSDIAGKKADFMGIDSTYGYTARNVYNLTAALYAETETERYSSVVMLVKENTKFRKFEDLKGSKACFPEYGSIASIAFINAAKANKILDKKDCEFHHVLENYFGESCLPGALDAFYESTFNNSERLCKLCKTEWAPYRNSLQASLNADESEDKDKSEVALERRDMSPTTIVPPNYNRFNCLPTAHNRFYGNKGALACLSEVGDVAVVEIQKLKEHAQDLKLDPNDFRIICKNNTPAAYTGFDVDEACYLTTIVDGEIVVRKDSTRNPGIVNALSSLDTYLQFDPDFKMYNIYRGIRNLLFEDSTLGLVSPNSTAIGKSVMKYIDLFKNMDSCYGGGANSVAVNLMLTLTLFLISLLLRR